MLSSPLLRILYPLSLVYGWGVALRLALYNRGICSAHRLPCKVISIGNLTLGGSGKTPVVAYLAGMFTKAGKRVAILSRGYRGRAGAGTQLVSDGTNVLLSAKEAGDEPVMLARNLPGVPVITNKDRYQAGLYACQRFQPQLVLLDDGFQHLALIRDVNILLVDEKILENDFPLFPAGPLREPLRNGDRADLIMYSSRGCSVDDLKRFGLNQPAVGFMVKPVRLVELGTGAARPVSVLRGQRVLAVAGIARPERFFRTITELGGDCKALSFPDHHLFRGRDYSKIGQAAAGCDMIVVTEKDAVRFDNRALAGWNIFSLGVEVSISSGQERFMKTLNQLLYSTA